MFDARDGRAHGTLVRQVHACCRPAFRMESSAATAGKEDVAIQRPTQRSAKQLLSVVMYEFLAFFFARD
jgi:hypothetical protein